LKIICDNGHDVEIIPEQINTLEEKHTAKNFIINYKLLLLMQLLGKGLKSIAIITALLGIHASLGFIPHGKACLISCRQSKPICCKEPSERN